MFIKEGGVSEAGRGGYWTVDPQYLNSDHQENEQCGRPKIQQINPTSMNKTEFSPGILPSPDVNGAKNGITTKGLKIEGIASMIQAKAASSLEAEGDPLQVSHTESGKSVFLSS